MKHFIVVLICLFAFALPVSAEETADALYEASGASDLDAGTFLEENGISFDDPESILNLSPSALWETIKEMFVSRVTAPLRLFISLVIVVIIAAVSESLGETLKKSSTAKLFELVCVLVSVSVLASPVCEVLGNTAKALSDGAGFMTVFVPVFAGVSAAGGHITSASGYNLLIMTVSDIVIQIADRVFMPVLSMCMCLAIVDSSCEAVSLSGLLNGLKKLVTWGLGLIMTVFTGLLSIQSVVGASADTLSAKTAKYLISNCVPVVGGAVSDAYSTVKGSIELIRNGVGGVGIAALAMTLLPSLISLVMYKLSLSAAGIAADVFGVKKVSKLFENINSVMSAALGVTVCFTLMFIVSTAMIMSVCS